MEAIKLDVLPGAMPPIVHVSQGDIGRQFKIEIYDETGAEYSLTGKTLSIVGHKQDGNVFQYSIPSSAISGNEVTITTEEQMTPVAGKTLCEICIEEGTTKLGTANFVMQVEQGPADMGLLSTSALYIIQALFNEATADVEAAQTAATTATQKATEAAASAASAAESLSQIGDAVDVATQKANEAASSASAAATSASQAAAAVEGVHDDAVAAQNAATAAATSASAASTSASAAATSATNASSYASAADTSADAASDFANAASQSASAASTSANIASTAATNASASESAAATSESNAASSASTASTAATNAAASASQAATSASNAATSESNAAVSATAAEDAKDAIEDMTVSSQTVPYTSPAEVTKSVVQGVVNLDFKIPRGEPMSGHEVIANPSGAATGGDLTKLGIDGTNYNVSGLPDSSQASNGDVLTKTASGPAWATPTKELPAIASGDAGKVLGVNANESGVEWITPQGGGDSAMNIPFNPHAYIGEIYDSGGTKVFDRTVDTSFEFVQGEVYNIRLFADAAKTLFDLKGKCIFLGLGQYMPYRYVAIPGTFTEDFSSMSSYLSGLGSMKYSYMLPDKVDVDTSYYDLKENLTKNASVKYVRESTDVNNVIYDKLKIIVNIYVNCTSNFTYEPGTSYEFDIDTIRSVPYYRSSNANVINV